MHPYETLTEALRDLQARGYDQNFNAAYDCLECKTLDLKLYPEHFTITEFHRFEGETDPADNSIVYAVESTDGVKGVLVNAYGVYGDTLSGEMAAKLGISSAAGQ